MLINTVLNSGTVEMSLARNSLVMHPMRNKELWQHSGQWFLQIAAVSTAKPHLPTAWTCSCNRLGCNESIHSKDRPLVDLKTFLIEFFYILLLVHV